MPLLWQHHYLLALGAIIFNRVCDGLDGALARRAGATDRGAFLDIALDFFFYGAVPFGFALADPPANALPAALLLLSLSVPVRAFCRPRFSSSAGASRLGISAQGPDYVGGLAEGGETIVAFWQCACAVGFRPSLTLRAVCLVTAAMRWTWTFRRLGR